MEYRRDVDGLRAVAVLAVVAFHLSKTSIPGGFLGVDMFFCLSGYLITSIIWRDVQVGEFSIRKFYDRRLRRIAPALVVVILATSCAATLVLLPVDLSGYGKSVVASIFFAANIYFWRDAGYFSRLAEEKPLLHIWSLGIEEQFYIFFPLILIFIWRFIPKFSFYAIFILMLSSLSLNIFAISMGAGNSAFYWLPTRAWELAVGALLALAPNIHVNPKVMPGLRWLALLLIGYGFATGSDIATVIPAAVPVIFATAILILKPVQSDIISRFLSTPFMVGIGLISFSLYLWHWPLIVFPRYFLIRELLMWEMGAALVAMFGAAYASWRWVEQPFRHRKMSIGKVYAFSGATSLLALAFGVFVVANLGLPGRLDAKAASINAAVGTNYRCAVSEYRVFGASRSCDLNLPSNSLDDVELVYLGNSHAQMFAPIVSDLLKNNDATGVLVPLSGCLPTISYNIAKACSDLARSNLEAVIALPRLRTVVLGMTYENAQLFDASGQPNKQQHSIVLRKAIDDLVQRLRTRGFDVVLVGPIAIPGYDVASEFGRSLAFGREYSKPLSVPMDQFTEAHMSLIDHYETQGSVTLIRPDLDQCRLNQCDFVRGDKSLFADSNHIAKAALPIFAARFNAALGPLLERR